MANANVPGLGVGAPPARKLTKAEREALREIIDRDLARHDGDSGVANTGATNDGASSGSRGQEPAARRGAEEPRRGADINTRNYRGNTPLHFCYSYGYGDTLGAYLISKGADSTLRNHSGFSCMEGLGGTTAAASSGTPNTHK